MVVLTAEATAKALGQVELVVCFVVEESLNGSRPILLRFQLWQRNDEIERLFGVFIRLCCVEIVSAKG